jgi:hypothetical protein
MKTGEDLLKKLYSAKAGKPEMITVPAMRFLMIDGAGDPNTAPAFGSAVEALYGIAYTVKFALKKSKGLDYRVPPLEGLWWSSDMSDFLKGRKDRWQWTLMIMQPKGVTKNTVEAARAQVHERKFNPAMLEVRFEQFKEGRCAQVLHIGPYATEEPTIRHLHGFIAEHGFRPRGKHHEIYLGDPRRAKPEKLRTIIRQAAAPL